MKKITGLLFMAALLFPTVASAQEDSAIQLDLGGYFRGYVATTSDQEATGTNNIRNTDIIRDTELFFSGKTTLDNGLTVGANLEADVDLGDDFSVDESFVYFSGDWGRINLGSEDGSAYILQVAAPSADANYDGVRQELSPMAFGGTAVAASGDLYGLETDRLDYDQNLSGKSDKITYITPLFSGFQAGVSYTPDLDNTRSFGNALDDESGDVSDVVDLAVRYEADFGTWNTRLGAGYTHSSLESDAALADAPTLWNIAADFDIGAFGVGAAYTEDSGVRDDDEAAIRNIVLGADYNVGSYTFGASYLDQTDKGQTTSVELDTKRYTAGAIYNFGPGMTLRGSLSYIENDSDLNANDMNTTVLLLGTEVRF